MLKRLMAHSFINILDKELKYYAKKSGDYFIYDRWNEKNYASLTSLEINLLRALDLSFLGLKTVPGVIGYFQNLEELNLSGNNLIELPSEIYTLKNLKVLNLGDIISGGNKLQAISKDIEKLTNLEVLQLVWNDDIKELPKEILNLQNINFISLSQGAIMKTKVGKEIEQRFCIDFEDLYN